MKLLFKVCISFCVIAFTAAFVVFCWYVIRAFAIPVD
jgi:hypothetical protein